MTAIRTILKYSSCLRSSSRQFRPAPAPAASTSPTAPATRINVIDPETNTVVQNIKGEEAAHGINFSPDGTRVYVSNEFTSTLDVFDQKSGNLIKKVKLSNHPNNITVAKDGRVFVGIAREPGALDVIDPTKLEVTKSIPMRGRLHNIYMTPDQKHVICGSVAKKFVSVVDAKTETVVWDYQFDKGVRPMTIETNPDGSTKRVFVQLAAFDGFAVLDFAKREEVARIQLPRPPHRRRHGRRPRRRPLARDRRPSGRQDPVGHQHSAERGVRLFARRPQAHRRHHAARAEIRPASRSAARSPTGSRSPRTARPSTSPIPGCGR